MFKKCRLIVISSLAAVSVMGFSAFADSQYETINADKNSINIVVDGERVIADNFLYNDTTYVPLRRIAEMLGKNVEYVEEGNKAVISDTENPSVTENGTQIPEELLSQSISVERNTMNIFVNGDKVDADNFLYNDTTYVPLRKISEMFSEEVSWDQLTNTASIGKKQSSVFDGTVLGTINGREYTDTLYDNYKNLYTKSGSLSENDDIDEVITEQIKYDFALMDTALENGVTAGVSFENNYQSSIKNFIAMYGGEEEFEKVLEENGYTYDMYHYVQIINDIFSKLSQNSKFAPTEEEIQKYYTDNRDAVFAFDGVRAKHILIMPQTDEEGNASEEEWKKALETAQKVYKLAETGTDFDNLIAEYNMDPGVESNPDGYIFGKGQMVAEFEDACYSMEPGDISEPVKTSYGYHIIKLEEKIPYYEFDDDVRAFIVSGISTQNLSKHLEKMVADSVVAKK